MGSHLIRLFNPVNLINKSSPRKRGSSNPLILEKNLDSRFRGNDRLNKTFPEAYNKAG
jgi:hypothetical protein